MKFLFNTKRSFQTVVKPLPWFNRVPGVCFQTKWSFLWVRHVKLKRRSRIIIQNYASCHPTAWCVLEFCCLTSCLLLLILDSISILLGIYLHVEVCFSGGENWRVTGKLDWLIHFFPHHHLFTTEACVQTACLEKLCFPKVTIFFLVFYALGRFLCFFHD